MRCQSPAFVFLESPPVFCVTRKKLTVETFWFARLWWSWSWRWTCFSPGGCRGVMEPYVDIWLGIIHWESIEDHFSVHRFFFEIQTISTSSKKLWRMYLRVVGEGKRVGLCSLAPYLAMEPGSVVAEQSPGGPIARGTGHVVWRAGILPGGFREGGFFLWGDLEPDLGIEMDWRFKSTVDEGIMWYVI